MAIDLTQTISRVLPGSLERRTKPLLRLLNQLLNGDDESAFSQRLALVVFIIRVASALIAFVSQVLLARWLGSFEYGVFVAVWVGIIILGTLASIGFPSGAMRFVAEYRERQENTLLRGVILASIAIVFLTSTLIALIGALILYQFPGLITQYYVTPVFLAAICLPMLSLQGVIDGICRSFNWPKTAFLPTFILRPIGILVVVGIALATGFSASAETVVWSAIIATYAASLFQLGLFLRKLKKSVPPGKVEFRIRYWMFVAFPIFLVEGFYALMTSVDILFVSSLMRPEDTATYFASVKILALVHFVYYAVKAAVSHRYTAYHTNGDIVAFRAFVQKTVSWTFWPSLILGLVMVVMGKYFLLLFGSEFVSGESLIWILVLGIIIRSSVGPAEALLVMSGRQKICASIYGFSLFINIVLNLTLIPVLGLHGAAIATTLAMTFESIGLYAAAKRQMGIHAFIIPQKHEPSDMGETANV